MSIQNFTKYCTIEQSCAKQQIVSQKQILYSAHAPMKQQTWEKLFCVCLFYNNDIYAVGSFLLIWSQSHMKTKRGL